ncbi:MAG: preprotein translocase subunit YajC [Alcanivorax sp.]
MLISKAYAAAAESTEALEDLANAPTPSGMLIWDIGLVVVIMVLFYLLLIMPQQRRFKEHSEMLSDLKKGDRVVTGGGLVGKIDKLLDEKEVVVDLGNGVKVTALRSMIQGKTDLKPKPAANDSKSSKDKKKV